jgi:glutathione S-transferase
MNDFRAVNPNGRVPAMQDENGTFWESLSINIYLASPRQHL